MDISIIIPAHNEQTQLPKCLDAVDIAKANTSAKVEVIVVLNRCTDLTPKIATERATKTVHEDAKNLSVIRNAGAAVATGDIIITVDADSYMHPNTFAEVIKKLESKKFIGGGAHVIPERKSIGIYFSLIALLPYLIWNGVSFGLFWCWRKDFEEVGGFDTDLISIEDLDFALRLKKLGKTRGLKFATLRNSPLITSCRKFDLLGDWYFFLNPLTVYHAFQGKNRKVANKLWYNARD